MTTIVVTFMQERMNSTSPYHRAGKQLIIVAMNSYRSNDRQLMAYWFSSLEWVVLTKKADITATLAIRVQQRLEHGSTKDSL